MTDNWHLLGEVNYRKWSVYDTRWSPDIDLDECLVRGAKFAGPVAIVPDHKQVGIADKVSIFSCSGQTLGSIPLKERVLVDMGWTDIEELLLVFLDGRVEIYDIHGGFLRFFRLIEILTNAEILECKFWGDGVVAISSDMRLWVAEGLASLSAQAVPVVVRLSSGLNKERRYTAMAIIPPPLTRSGMLEVLLATSDASIIVVDHRGAEDQLMSDRLTVPILKISVAPNGRFLACFRRDGVLSVMSSSFNTKVLDFESQSLVMPLDVAWCGEDAVVLVWRDSGLVMVGPYGDWITLPYDERVHLVSESDCCRIVTPYSCELLQRVPLCTENVRRIGSTEPAALLFDAAEAFEEGDPKSDDNISALVEQRQLESAVLDCIDAAAHEFDQDTQKALMRAAAFGKVFCTGMDPNVFVETAVRLRVLNQVSL